MTSPKARRRQRSTRLTVAVALVTAGAAIVLGALVLQSSVVTAVAAVLAVVLGAAATRITHSELMRSRWEAARDRAEQAQAYRTMATERADENAEHVGVLTGRIVERESSLRELEEALVAAQRRAAEATRNRNAEARRADLADQQNASLSGRLEQAEERAARAIVHLAELEQEVEVLRAEVSAWHAMSSEPLRRHA